MGYGEKRGDWYRGRYWIAPGVLRTVVDAQGRTVRFNTKRDAAKAANDHEAEVRLGSWRDMRAEKKATALELETFADYANRWYAAQDLAASTMQNYRRHIEEHLLPKFGEMNVAEIERTDIEAWEKKERAAQYAPSSIKTWRGTLHLILSDAVEEQLRESNPATKRRGRGKRAGRSRNRAPEKVVTDALGMLLIAERASILSGRDDEFVALIMKGYTGMRWAKLSVWRRGSRAGTRSESNGSCTSWTRANWIAARPRTTRTATSTLRVGCRTSTWATSPGRSLSRAPATD